MSLRGKIAIPTKALLEFSGPDAIRFLNGQLTQDVRKVIGSGKSWSSCVTDAKGKLQFRVWLAEAENQAIWVSCEHGDEGELEARLTRYLIADDVEVRDRTAELCLVHLLDCEPKETAGMLASPTDRFGTSGIDCWLPVGAEAHGLDEIDEIPMDQLEDFRISHAVPAWGKELQPGMLPPEANLETTDISYAKGCYIGQEVISRIKSAGKVNRNLQRFSIPSDVPDSIDLSIYDGDRIAGEITSISPMALDGTRAALGYLKRGAGESNLSIRRADGEDVPVSLL
ncbi:hypothetical protein JIN85_01590 [Luteolibacter pohnpeiensis]|uniref:Aminomethyltransferase folate-binding domain-containing protein n=1 Tax=Luteolibacter pohnpeiensis TaxID=454153 RepID=A0A934S4J0_9BACT|nr:hypothetical protein [Luteolibacter pohnpeiensis]MBK1881085.1 hypothetical protein [Luteolibacter pohnpeiensis]